METSLKDGKRLDTESRFEPTYKEWKPRTGPGPPATLARFEPTYKEWKRLHELRIDLKQGLVSSLPIRNGNPPRPRR